MIPMAGGSGVGFWPSGGSVPQHFHPPRPGVLGFGITKPLRRVANFVNRAVKKGAHKGKTAGSSAGEP